MNKRKVGAKYEEIAAIYLNQHGYEVIARNYRTRIGEIDIIALKFSEKDNLPCEIHFVEVKYRKNQKYGMPQEAVDFRKQKQICKVYDYFNITHPEYNHLQPSFDVISICDSLISLYENVFYYNSNALF